METAHTSGQGFFFFVLPIVLLVQRQHCKKVLLVQEAVLKQKKTG